MSNNDYHMTPFKKGEFNPTVIIVFIIIVILIVIGAYVYLKYIRW